jgi:hypothetical protein
MRKEDSLFTKSREKNKIDIFSADRPFSLTFDGKAYLISVTAVSSWDGRGWGGGRVQGVEAICFIVTRNICFFGKGTLSTLTLLFKPTPLFGITYIVRWAMWWNVLHVFINYTIFSGRINTRSISYEISFLISCIENQIRFSLWNKSIFDLPKPVFQNSKNYSPNVRGLILSIMINDIALKNEIMISKLIHTMLELSSLLVFALHLYANFIFENESNIRNVSSFYTFYFVFMLPRYPPHFLHQYPFRLHCFVLK